MPAESDHPCFVAPEDKNVKIWRYIKRESGTDHDCFAISFPKPLSVPDSRCLVDTSLLVGIKNNKVKIDIPLGKNL